MTGRGVMRLWISAVLLELLEVLMLFAIVFCFWMISWGLAWALLGILVVSALIAVEGLFLGPMTFGALQDLWVHSHSYPWWRIRRKK